MSLQETRRGRYGKRRKSREDEERLEQCGCKPRSSWGLQKLDEAKKVSARGSLALQTTDPRLLSSSTVRDALALFMFLS